MLCCVHTLDSKCLTREFNFNLLSRLNREVKASVDPSCFAAMLVTRDFNFNLLLRLNREGNASVDPSCFPAMLLTTPALRPWRGVSSRRRSSTLRSLAKLCISILEGLYLQSIPTSMISRRLLPWRMTPDFGQWICFSPLMILVCVEANP